MKPGLHDARKYAPVLGRMIELLGSNPTLPFGTALLQAAKDVGVEVPDHMLGPLLVSAFDVIANGKIPGLPEA